MNLHHLRRRDDLAGFEAEVTPQLPALPAEPMECKLSFASEYKELGNRLFKSGKREWALCTYLVGVQLLQRVCYANPDAILYDVEVAPVCVASFRASSW